MKKTRYSKIQKRFIETTLIRFLMKLCSAATNIAEFANRVDLDELAHYVLPHPALHCLPFSL